MVTSEASLTLCRCARCESFYNTDSTGLHPSACRYHTGTFRQWWSCCKVPLHSAPGCRTGAHIEDKSYTAMLDSLGPSSLKGRLSAVATSQA